MGEMAGDHRVTTRQADRFAVLQTVDVAVAWANPAGPPKELEPMLDPPLELPTPPHLDIFHWGQA